MRTQDRNKIPADALLPTLLHTQSRARTNEAGSHCGARPEVRGYPRVGSRVALLRAQTTDSRAGTDQDLCPQPSQTPGPVSRDGTG